MDQNTVGHGNSTSTGQSAKPNVDSINKTLKDRHQNRKDDSDYKKSQKGRKKLQIFQQRVEILKLVQENSVVLLFGGQDKNRQVAQFLLDEAIEGGVGSSCRIISIQSTQSAAYSTAQAVSKERYDADGQLGRSVGYKTFLHSELPRKPASIFYVTAEYLLKHLQSNMHLVTFSHVIIDDFDERNLSTDSLAHLLLSKLRNNPKHSFKIILLSKMGDTVSNYLKSRNFSYEKLEISGKEKSRPAKTLYLEDALAVLDLTDKFPEHDNRGVKRKKWGVLSNADIEDNNYKMLVGPSLLEWEAEGVYSDRVLEYLSFRQAEESSVSLVEKVLQYIIDHDEEPGAIVVFMKDDEDAVVLYSSLMRYSTLNMPKYRSALPLLLHSLACNFSEKEDIDYITKGARKKQRIVVTTGIPGGSLPIHDLGYVIDCGKLVRTGDENRWIDLWTASQRQGLLGRTKPGTCYRLYSKLRESTFSAHPAPSKKTLKQLEDLILRIKMLTDQEAASFFQQIPEPLNGHDVHLALERLKKIGALDLQEHLTPLGSRIAQLQVDPRIAKLLLMGSIFCCLKPILSIAAVLSYRSPYRPRTYQPDKEKFQKIQVRLDQGRSSDHLVFADILEQFGAIPLSPQDENSTWRKAREAYCETNMLHCYTMYQLHAFFVPQFAADLRALNFVSSGNPMDPASNRNSGNHCLIKALLTACLFPNLALIGEKKCKHSTAECEKGKCPLPIVNWQGSKAVIDPDSVNFRPFNIASSSICFHGHNERDTISIKDCSVASPFALEFFFAQESSAKLYGLWEKHFSSRLSHPRPTNWTQDWNLLEEVINFISQE